MNIDKQKVEKELDNIKHGIYDKYYHNIFKYLSEHTFEREDAKRILQIENYKVTDNFVEIEQNDVKFVIDYKNEKCYIGFKNAVNEYDMENYQEYMKQLCVAYNKSTMENLKNSIVRIVFHYNLMIFLLGTVIFKTQGLYLTVSSDIFDFNNIK
jgi:hypothetical protein